MLSGVGSHHTALYSIAMVIGWIYFVAWSYSFYPQVYLNLKTKSVKGLSFEFCHINMLGHTSYNIYNSLLYFSPVVQTQWQKFHNTSTFSNC